jgi:hypothetical protein
VLCKKKKQPKKHLKAFFMIEQILQNIPEDAPELLTNFILEKEQELGGKFYVQLAYKNILLKGKTQKNAAFR